MDDPHRQLVSFQWIRPQCPAWICPLSRSLTRGVAIEAIAIVEEVQFPGNKWIVTGGFGEEITEKEKEKRKKEASKDEIIIIMIHPTLIVTMDRRGWSRLLK